MRYGIKDITADKAGPRGALVIYRDWDTIPMHSIYLQEYEQDQNVSYHWGFKDSEQWFNCTQPMAFSLNPQQAAHYLPHIPVFKLPVSR